MPHDLLDRFTSIRIPIPDDQYLYRVAFRSAYDVHKAGGLVLLADTAIIRALARTGSPGRSSKAECRRWRRFVPSRSASPVKPYYRSCRSLSRVLECPRDVQD
jgi:hypothetical protein